MANPEDFQETFSIPQAAKILKVTAKTIRNYLDRGFLDAEKWNGAWRINSEHILELYYKKYGKNIEKIEIESARTETYVQVTRAEYDKLQQRTGQLEVAELQIKELGSENRTLNDRLGQLEASSASGWTEARQYKDGCAKMEKELKSAQEKVSEAQLEANWLRRELDHYRKSVEEYEERVRDLEEQIEDLSKGVQDRENDLEGCEKEMEELRRRYRRDSFLG